MDGMCGSLHRRHCCIKGKFAQISRRCTSHACSWAYHTYGISWHRIKIAAQVDAHTIDNTSDGCSVACTPAVQSYNSSVITHPIIYFIAPNNAIMTYMTSVPMIFPSPHFHNQHNKSIRRWLISICILYHLWAIYTHTHSHTQSLTHLHYLAVLRNSPHKRNNLAC
jgi:hypothetical protein